VQGTAVIQHVRQNLPPECALRAAAGDAHLGDLAQSHRFDELEAISQTEGDAFQHRARQVCLLVPRASGSG
jgi:hypothetical protein